jgi:hypothetical protein
VNATVRVLLPALSLALLSSTPATADWLVLRGGGRVETAGPWTEKGALVVFTTAAGALSSLRVAEVDLEESAKVTSAARRAAEAAPMKSPPPVPRRAVLVLTDKDIPPAALEVDAEQAAGATEEAATGADSLTVASWDQQYDPDAGAAVVTGTLNNRGDAIAADVDLTVMAYDEQGNLIGRVPASLEKRFVPPGATVGFRAVFPGLAPFATAKFDLKGASFSRRTGSAPGGAATNAPPPSAGPEDQQPAEEPPESGQ